MERRINITNNETKIDLPSSYMIGGKKIKVTREFEKKGPSIIDVLIDLFVEQEKVKLKEG